MPRRGLELCIICCEAPCVCSKDAPAAKRPRSTQRRSNQTPAQSPPAAEQTAQQPAQARPEANPWDTDDPPAPTHAQIMQHDVDLEWERAIAALTPILHPDDRPKCIAERAVLWRERHS